MNRVLLSVAALFIPLAVAAHDAVEGVAYDSWCCKGTEMSGDCAPIPESAVQVTPKGFIITLHPGDHPLVTRDHVWTIPYDSPDVKIHDAVDEHWHLCLFPNEDSVRCIYLQRWNG